MALDVDDAWRSGMKNHADDDTPRSSKQHHGLATVSFDSATTATFTSCSIDGVSLVRDGSKHRTPLQALLSNIFFFSGSVLYVLLASWNHHRLRYHAPTDLPDIDSSMEDDYSSGLPSISWHDLICGLAPLCYVVDAVLQLGRLPIADSGHLHQGFQDKPILEAGVQLTFGFAAICDLMSALIFRAESPSSSYDFSIAAVHWYLINAILMISSKQVSCQSKFMRLSLIGDILFLIGSLIDVFLSYFYNTQTSDETWRLVSIGKVLSSLLWLVDSILYILADLYDSSDGDGDNDLDDDFLLDDETSVALVVTQEHHQWDDDNTIASD